MATIQIGEEKLSREVKKKIKKALPHGWLKEKAHELGVHYNTALNFDNPKIQKAAIKAIAEKKRGEKEQRGRERKFLQSIGIR